MAKDTTKNMTVGSPMKLILGFSVPLLFGFLFQQLYNVVDMVIVGRFLGVNALASVGLTGSLNFMVIGFCMGLCNGFSIPVSQKFGARDYVGMRKFIANGIWLAAIFSVVITLIVTALCHNILELMKTPEDIIEGSYSYIIIIFIGIPSVFLYNILSGIIRAIGDSKTPLIFLAISSVLNIGLDLLFIVGFRMGVSGAAVATVTSQTISGLLCLIFLVKKFEILRVQKEEWKLDTSLIYILCGMGIPMGLQYSITAIGSVILQSAVNTLGSSAVASVTAAGKVSLFFCCPFDAMGATMATYTGQNVGAGKLERLTEGIKACTILGIIYSLVAFIILWLFGQELTTIFVNKSETHILQNAARFLLINSAFYIPLALVNIVRFTIQGMGYSPFAILAGVCEMVARALAGLLLVPILGFTGACFASPLAWIFADAFLIPAYLHVKKKLTLRIARS